MRNILIILFLISTSSIADSQKNKTIENKLTTVLHNLKKFKKEKNYKISQLQKELDTLKKRFYSYKVKKEKELKKANSKLRLTRKELLNTKIQNKNKIKNIQNKLLKSQHKVKQSEAISQLTIQQSMEEAMSEPIPMQIEVQTEEDAPLAKIILPINSNTPWIEITVEDDMDIFQLAKLYYGDSNQYIHIYSANRDIIPSSLKLHNNMSLKIPITSQFRDQPIVLNRD